MLVSENLARELWRTPEGALGKQVRVGSKDLWRQVVAAVANGREDGVNQKSPTIVYWPLLMKDFEGTPIFTDP